MTLARGVACGAGGDGRSGGGAGAAGSCCSGSGVRAERGAALEALSLRASPRADVEESFVPFLRPGCPVSCAEGAPLSEMTVNSLGTSDETGATGPCGT